MRLQVLAVLSSFLDRYNIFSNIIMSYYMVRWERFSRSDNDCCRSAIPRTVVALNIMSYYMVRNMASGNGRCRGVESDTSDNGSWYDGAGTGVFAAGIAFPTRRPRPIVERGKKAPNLKRSTGTQHFFFFLIFPPPIPGT